LREKLSVRNEKALPGFAGKTAGVFFILSKIGGTIMEEQLLYRVYSQWLRERYGSKGYKLSFTAPAQTAMAQQERVAVFTAAPRAAAMKPCRIP